MPTTKSKKKSEFVNFVTPFGIARFTHITKPDTEGKLADNKFKTGIVWDDDADVESMRQQQTAAAKQLWPGVPLENLNLPLKEVFDKDRDSGEKTAIGWGITAKSKRRPVVVDAKRKKLPADAKIGSGSELRLGGVFASYERPIEEIIVENGVKRKEKSIEQGLTCYLNSVQVKVLRQGGFSDGSEFEEVEGFEYEGSGEDDAGSEFNDNDATEL